jgi:shikimate kinase
MSTAFLRDGSEKRRACISLIGMAGAGKSTVGRHLACLLGWELMDTDHLMEAAYGASLQQISDALGKEAFLDAEAAVIGGIRARRLVLATGGSAVCRKKAARHLRTLGPLVYLDVPLPLILERIARNPQRGLAIAPGQSVEDLFHERRALYKRYASCTIKAGALAPEACAKTILALLEHVRFETVA